LKKTAELKKHLIYRNALKAERVWFLSEEGRRAKPETEQLLPRRGKKCVFLNSLARASLQTVFSTSTLVPSYYGKRILPFAINNFPFLCPTGKWVE